MGYTHYWRQSRDFTDKEWEQINAVFFKLNTSKLGDWSGDGDMTLAEDNIGFNGRGELAHETFVLQKSAEKFAFCKTGEKPYDFAVCVVLTAAQIVAPDAIKVSTDAKSFKTDNWPMAKLFVEDILKKPITISQDTFNKLVLALRCADADLQGVQQRYHSCMAPDRHEEDAANLTREEIAIVYKELTGKEINDA